MLNPFRLAASATFALVLLGCSSGESAPALATVTPQAPSPAVELAASPTPTVPSASPTVAQATLPAGLTEVPVGDYLVRSGDGKSQTTSYDPKWTETVVSVECVPGDMLRIIGSSRDWYFAGNAVRNLTCEDRAGTIRNAGTIALRNVRLQGPQFIVEFGYGSIAEGKGFGVSATSFGVRPR